MWLILGFVSAALLGLYDVSKKQSLRGNAVIPVLFLNTLLCSLLFLPLVVGSSMGWLHAGEVLYIPPVEWATQRYIIIKAFIVLSSWLCAYFGMKHLPLTLVGPINATRPVLVLLGAILVYGEQLNVLQWMGVVCTLVSLYLLNRSGKKEGIDFRHNKWMLCVAGGALLGAVSGLYDKYLLAPVENGGIGLDRMVVQSYYNFYQCGLMLLMLAIIWWPARERTTRFEWRWSIVCISVFLSIADFVYFYALSLPGAMVSVVSLARRSSVLVSFLIGALVLREKNLRSKLVDLLLVLVGMLFLYFGSR